MRRFVAAFATSSESGDEPPHPKILLRLGLRRRHLRALLRSSVRFAQGAHCECETADSLHRNDSNCMPAQVKNLSDIAAFLTSPPASDAIKPSHRIPTALLDPWRNLHDDGPDLRNAYRSPDRHARHGGRQGLAYS